MSAKSVGELVGPILARADAIAALNFFLLRLNGDDRKQAIMVLREGGIISPSTAGLLIEQHGLEAL